jgi:catechol 2,3-dioxygenase-like lactoylglutathione lyase family enzyme
MAILGIKSLRYGVEDVSTGARFFADFGLQLVEHDEAYARFSLPEGSTVEILPVNHPSLPRSSVEGPGVQEVVWGVDTPEALALLVADLSRDLKVTVDAEGVHHFLSPFGIAMGLASWQRKTVVCAPDALNSPGNIQRLNTHRKWRRRALPKVITHVVFRAADYLSAAAFMRERLNFRLTDVQVGVAVYIRADGRNEHHNFAVLNANSPFPGCDGTTRFDHANFGVEDIDELMIGANNMSRKGWGTSQVGLGRHRADSALFYYLPAPVGGEAEYGADGDTYDDGWAPRRFHVPLFAYAMWTHNLPPFLEEPPDWAYTYLTGDELENPQSLTSR